MNQSLLVVETPPLDVGGPQNRDFGYFSIGPETANIQFSDGYGMQTMKDMEEMA